MHSALHTFWLVGIALAALVACASAQCTEPSLHCMICTQTGTCDRCEAGYSTDSIQLNVCDLVTCPIKHCQYCDKSRDGTIMCSVCNEGFAVKGSVCVPIDCSAPDCMQCTDESPNTCRRCIPGFQLSASGTCSRIPCSPEGCAGCEPLSEGDGLQCAMCQPAYRLVGGRCLLNRCGIVGCLGCTEEGGSVCALCGDTYTLIGGQCVRNRDATMPPMSGIAAVVALVGGGYVLAL